MSRRATSISRTAPRAQGITSVVRTARTPSSWQTAEQGVHARRVRGGELGDVADPHEERRVGVAPTRLGVPFERTHEPEPDRLDDGVDEVGDPPLLERGDAPLQRLESLTEIGD